MARLFSRLMTSRHHLKKNGGVFVMVAVGVFALVVFLLFRGHSSGPQEAAASDAPPISGPAGTAADASSSSGAQTPPAAGQGQALPGETAGLSTSATSPQAPEIDAAVAEAVKLVRSEPGAVIQARDKLNKLLQAQTAPGQRQTIKDEMAKLSKDWLFGPAAFPGDMLCDTYTVKSGDLLDILGRRMKVPHEVLMQINGIQRAQNLQAGRAIKVIHGPFHAKVSRSTFTLDLYLQDMYVRSFKVGLGKSGYETPVGRWRVQEHGKLVKPPWTDPDTGRLYKSTDPDYPLGSRWIGLEGVDGSAKGRTGFAIHGTKDPEQIGSAGSRGCIRMYNDDAILMYNLLVPLNSQVEVTD
jgi:LysM repeat protein